MKVHGIGNQHAHALGQLKRQQSQEAQIAKAGAEESKKPESKPAAAGQDIKVDGEPKGVIRLLQQGHFNGVADLRLRIVHHEQIQEVTTQAAAESLETEGQKLISAIGEEIKNIGLDFGIEEDKIQETIAAFQEKLAANSVDQDYGQLNTETIRTIYQGAFYELILALSAFEPETGSKDTASVPAVEDNSGELSSISNDEPVATAAEPTETGTGEVDPEPTAFQQALGGLEEMLRDGLQSIVTNMNELLSLPPLSQPGGNGVAYEKFLKIYNALQGSAEDKIDDTATSEITGIETNA